MGVRLAAKIGYLKDRLAGRAGQSGSSGGSRAAPPHEAADISAARSASHPIPLWVLPGHLTYTGAEGADVASLWNFLTGFSCFLGFGSGVWADAR